MKIVVFNETIGVPRTKRRSLRSGIDDDQDGGQFHSAGVRQVGKDGFFLYKRNDVKIFQDGRPIVEAIQIRGAVIKPGSVATYRTSEGGMVMVTNEE